MARLFWIIIGLLTAASVHILYVLLVPGMALESNVAALSGNAARNTFHVLPARSTSALMPGHAGDGVSAMCRIDLGKGKVGLSLQVPDMYWTLAIYSQSGKQIYALNDKQAGVDRFDIEITRARSLIEMVTSLGEVEEGGDEISNAAWTVEMPDSRGLMLLWVPLPDPLLRPAVESILSAGTCVAKAPAL